MNIFSQKKTVYYKVVKDRAHYIGIKYFAVATDSDTVIQVCNCAGVELRRGRTNAVGLYTLTKLSFLSNYLAMGYVEIIPKKEFISEMNKIITAFQKLF